MPTRVDRTADMVLGGLLLEAASGLRHELGKVHAEQRLLGREFDALLRLFHSPGNELRMTELARQTQTSTSGATALIDRLEKRGLVQRSTDPADRRSYRAQLTETGREAVERDMSAVLPVISRLLVEPLGAERQEFERLLRKVRDAVNPDAAPHG